MIVKLACESRLFVHPSVWNLQNTKELTSRWVFKGAENRSLKHIQCLQGIYVWYGILSSSPGGNRVSHSPDSYPPCPILCEVTPTPSCFLLRNVLNKSLHLKIKQ